MTGIDCGSPRWKRAESAQPSSLGHGRRSRRARLSLCAGISSRRTVRALGADAPRCDLSRLEHLRGLRAQIQQGADRFPLHCPRLGIGADLPASTGPPERIWRRRAGSRSQPKARRDSAVLDPIDPRAGAKIRLTPSLVTTSRPPAAADATTLIYRLLLPAQLRLSEMPVVRRLAIDRRAKIQAFDHRRRPVVEGAHELL